MTDESTKHSQKTIPDDASVTGAEPKWFVLPRWLRRYTRRSILLSFAVGAALLVSLVTVDLGPAVRARVEASLSAEIDRPVHIGRLGTYLLPGHFFIEDLVIEGLSLGDEPFFTSERIEIAVSWWALLRGEFLIDSVEISGWRMLVESFSDELHNFPEFVQIESGEEESVEDTVSEVEQLIVTTLSFIHAYDGEFIYRDHITPWSVVSPDAELTLTKGETYGGEFSLEGTTLQIMSFEPMIADMQAAYELDGWFVDLTKMNLFIDGVESAWTGRVDVLNWPEQIYNVVESDIDLPLMKDVFFAGDPFTVDGDGKFIGTWHIFDGGRELTGSFQSENATLNDLAFPELDGSLVWTVDRFEILDGTSEFYDGELEFIFEMEPLGVEEPSISVLETRYKGVDVAAFAKAWGLDGVRPNGRATGTNLLRWSLVGFDQRTGEGRLIVTPPDGVLLMDPLLPVIAEKISDSYADVPFNQGGEPWHFPFGGEVTYTLEPEWIQIQPSWLATSYTIAEFEGRTSYGDRSHIPFKVDSLDWQESDRVLASILTAFGSPTNEFTVEGIGQVNGVLLGEFTDPRIEGLFTGESIRAWNVEWGSGSGVIAVENSYLDIEEGLFVRGSAELHLDGRFAIGFPRPDGGEEINATVGMVSFPAPNVRDAFELEGYDIEGLITSEMRLYGLYSGPSGFGRIALDDPFAYGEPFDSASAGLLFEGGVRPGVRIDGLEMPKGGGQVTGAAFVRWDGTYSFNGNGHDIAMSSIESGRYEEVPLEGLVQFTISGAGAFDNPRYEARGSITDLVVNNEIVGQVLGRLDIRDGVMGLEVEAASPRLAVSGSGRIELTKSADAELLLRFINTNIDPYVRAFRSYLPSEVSVIVSGTLRVIGELGNLDQLAVDVSVEQLTVEFLDYTIRNEGLLSIGLYDNTVLVDQMRLVGDGTAIELSGKIGLRDEQVALSAAGDAGLGILQGFLPDVRSSGRARLSANIGGTLSLPVITGEAVVDDGRIRYLSLPHGLENINGRIVFEPDGIIFNGLTGELGGGRVRFGGRIGLRGYEVGDLGITISGTDMRLRFPEGVRSVIDADLTLSGEIADPVLSGSVNVRDAIWLEFFTRSTSLLDLIPEEDVLTPQLVDSTFPIRLDVRIIAPSTIRISDNTARVTASAEIILGGTYDRPLLFGNAQIDHGEVFFAGNRYRVTRGSIGFDNPTEFEPSFDIEAETDVRVPGQTYRVTLGVVGTMERIDFELSSDPPLPEFEILSMLLGDVRDPQAAELRSFRAQEASRQELFQASAARLLTGRLSSGVGRVVEESFGVDTFEITPSLAGPSAQQSAQLLPTARVLIGKRISDRAHVMFSRALTGANQDIIVVLEYDQTDRLSWILSQNEDRTYALDFRVRHTF